MIIKIRYARVFNRISYILDFMAFIIAYCIAQEFILNKISKCLKEQINEMTLDGG